MAETKTQRIRAWPRAGDSHLELVSLRNGHFWMWGIEGPPWLSMPALQSEGASGRWRRKLSLALGPAGISRRHSNQRALLGFFAAHAIGAFSFRLWSFAVPLVLMVHASR